MKELRLMVTDLDTKEIVEDVAVPQMTKAELMQTLTDDIQLMVDLGMGTVTEKTEASFVIALEDGSIKMEVLEKERGTQ